MHPTALRTEALALAEQGLNDVQIARRLGVPRTTVRDWRRPRYVRKKPAAVCSRCWQSMTPVSFTPDDYAELLGLYLGDGHISVLGRTERLRLSLDTAHPRILDETEALVRRCFPRNRVGRVTADDGATTVVWLYHRHLACLFPQTGAGKKHERQLDFEPWQRALIGEAGWAFVRGCIRSDGCVFVNRTGPYEYLSYDFANLSGDIMDLFVETCEALGLRPRRYATHCRLYRRDDVAQLRWHVGVKR